MPSTPPPPRGEGAAERPPRPAAGLQTSASAVRSARWGRPRRGPQVAGRRAPRGTCAGPPAPRTQEPRASAGRWGGRGALAERSSCCDTIDQTSCWWGLLVHSCSFCSPGFLWGGVIDTNQSTSYECKSRSKCVSSRSSLGWQESCMLLHSNAEGTQVSNKINRY